MFDMILVYSYVNEILLNMHENCEGKKKREETTTVTFFFRLENDCVAPNN